MQDILFRWESNRSRFRSYAPAAVPSPLQASVLICPGFSFFCTFFLPPYRCIGIFLNLSLSALMPDGREEQSVCSVLVAPCIRSSSCSFLIAVVVASSINANLSLSIFFSSFLSAALFLCCYIYSMREFWGVDIFLRIFFVWWICRKNTEFGWEFGLYAKKQSCTCCQAVFAAWKRNRKAEHNARTGGSVQQSIYCRL